MTNTVATVIRTLASHVASNFRATVEESGESFLILAGTDVATGKPLRLKIEETKSKDEDTVAFNVTSAPLSTEHRAAMGLDPYSFKGTMASDESRSRIQGKSETVWERMSKGYKGQPSAIADHDGAETFAAGGAADFKARNAATLAALRGVSIDGDNASVKVGDESVKVKVVGETVLVLGLRLTVDKANAVIEALTA